MCKIVIPLLTSKGPYYEAVLRSLNIEPVVMNSTDFSVDEFDGLLIPGGQDVDPSLYGEANEDCRNVNRKEDDLQLAFIDAFVKAGKPILGICRGSQLINVYFGGTLLQNIAPVKTHYGHLDAHGGPVDQIHGACAEKNSWLCKLYGEHFSINSYHHQAIDRLADDLEVISRADDGTMEGYRHKTLPIFGVQWHPERCCLSKASPNYVDGSLVYRFFLEQCSHKC